VVAFNSLGSGDTYNSATVWGVSGASTSGGYRGQAEWFVPSVTGYLSSFALPTYRVSGSGRSNFFIADDAAEGVPNDALENFLNVANNSRGMLTVNSISHPLLEAGHTYWLCDEPADATTSNGWFQNNQNRNVTFAFDREQGSWAGGGGAPNGAFRVMVTPVPEPSSLVFLLAAVPWLFWSSRRDIARV
jgi:hypothetical protein